MAGRHARGRRNLCVRQPRRTLSHLRTNVDNSDLERGLKIDDNFSAEARFDLATPRLWAKSTACG
jgi:hypothetical protein